METATTIRDEIESFVEGIRLSEVYDEFETEAIRRRFEAESTSAVLTQLAADARFSGDGLAELWSDATNLAHVDPMGALVQPEAIEAIPFEIATKAKAIGIHIFADVLTVAMADPLDETLLQRLERICGRSISPVFAFESEIADAIATHYKGNSPLEVILKEAQIADLPALQSLDEDGLVSLARTTPIIKLFDSLLLFTLQARGTDIHLQPEEHGLAFRVRVDGYLRTIGRLPRHYGPPLVTRAKVLCTLDIAESRLPQDGRFSLTLGGHSAHFRVSTLPSIHGEKLVVRVLTSADRRGFIPLDKMQLSNRVLAPLRKLMTSSNGILFVTGPTGSGKTSTIYAALHEINEPHVNILTIEDPVEHQVAGLTQVQVRRQAGLDFPTVLRSVLRQDPDILLVGEIRDSETARIASEAALTGHLVFSTLHTNNAGQAILRLTEMGVEPHVVAPAVIGVVAQRLVRRICAYCSESYAAPPDLLEHYFNDVESCGEVILHRGRGCGHCGGSGYHGRLGIHELIVVSDEMRESILAGTTVGKITNLAIRNGTRSLRYDGLLKALVGLTTLEEVERVTVQEWE